MSATHTPGPWTVEREGRYLVQIMGRGPANAAAMEERGDRDLCIVAEIVGGHAAGVAEANAKLIAAAPLMKSTLLEVLRWMTSRDRSLPAGVFPPIDLLRDVIFALKEAGVDTSPAAEKAAAARPDTAAAR